MRRKSVGPPRALVEVPQALDAVVPERLEAAGAASAEPQPFADLEARWRKDLQVNALDAKTQLDLVTAVLGQMAPLSIEKSQLLAQANQLRTSLASATAATDVKDTTKQLLLLSTKTVQTARTERGLAEAIERLYQTRNEVSRSISQGLADDGDKYQNTMDAVDPAGAVDLHERVRELAVYIDFAMWRKDEPRAVPSSDFQRGRNPSGPRKIEAESRSRDAARRFQGSLGRAACRRHTGERAATQSLRGEWAAEAAARRAEACGGATGRKVVVPSRRAPAIALAWQARRQRRRSCQSARSRTNMLALLALNFGTELTGRYGSLSLMAETGRNTHESGLIDTGTTNLEEKSHTGPATARPALAWFLPWRSAGDPREIRGRCSPAPPVLVDKTPAN